MNRFFDLLLLAVCSLLGSANAVSLAEAIGSQKVKAEFTVNSGTHFGENFNLKLTNLGTNALNLTIDPGFLLEPDDENFQIMMIVREEKVILPGNKSPKTLPVVAVCTQKDKTSPIQGSAFSLGKKADPILVEAARFINSQKLFETNGQWLVWSISDKETPDFICSLPAGEREQIEQFYNKQNLYNDHCTGYFDRLNSPVTGVSPPRKRFRLGFEVYVAKLSVIEIAVFDTAGNKVKTLHTDYSLPPRVERTYRSEFYSTEIGESGTYEVRLMVNGEIRKHYPIDF